MLKKFLFVAALLITSVTLSAQKIAYVNTESLYMDMPEVSELESTIATLNESYRTELTKMQEEFQKKYAEFMEQQESLPENIRVRRQQEVQELQLRIQNFVEVAEEDVQKKQRELLEPINLKIKDTIKKVAEENSYTYVIEGGVLLYTAPDGIDATPMVKQKLSK